jgi:hypothetical protein
VSRRRPWSSRARPALVGTVLMLGVMAMTPEARAQPRPESGDDQSDARFVEVLRREDPASAERYTVLRDARSQAIAELQKAQAQYNSASPELKVVFISQLKQARRKYAETSLALLDFLEARDRRMVATYEKEIARINGLLDERKRTRDELEQLLRGN